MTPGQLFLRPDAWPLLLLAPVIGLVLYGLDRARAARLERTIGPRRRELAGEAAPFRRRMRRAAFAAALLLAVLAILGPGAGAAEREVEWRGVDVVVALDVSRSMRARDLAPDRLGRARAEIRAFAGRAEGNRVGLVVFAGEARLVAPLTSDVASFAELADLADPSDIARGGTDLGAALTCATQALERARGHGVIVLLTDGEDLGGRGRRAAAACRARGVVVHCIGLGSARGSKIPLAAEDGPGFVRDPSGSEVVSRMDVASLRAIAEATGGTFSATRASTRPLARLYAERILPLARTAVATAGTQRRGDGFQWPLAAAILLLMLHLGSSDRRRA